MHSVVRHGFVHFVVLAGNVGSAAFAAGIVVVAVVVPAHCLVAAAYFGLAVYVLLLVDPELISGGLGPWLLAFLVRLLL